jgi:hypothetical protein
MKKSYHSKMVPADDAPITSRISLSLGSRAASACASAMSSLSPCAADGCDLF